MITSFVIFSFCAYYSQVRVQQLLIYNLQARKGKLQPQNPSLIGHTPETVLSGPSLSSQIIDNEFKIEWVDENVIPY